MASGVTNGNEIALGSGRSAWHGMGNKAEGAMTSAEAGRLSGLDSWEPVLEPMFVHDGGGDYRDVVAHRAIIRSDTREVLGVCGGQYRPIRNSAGFSMLDGMVADGKMTYETAGALWGGRVVWMLCRFSDVDEIVPGDKVERYGLFSNPTDGTGCARMVCTTVRVVCQNTLNAALSGAAETIRFRHDAKAEDRMRACSDLFARSSRRFEDFASIARALAEVRVSASDIAEYVEKVMPVDDEMSAKTKERVLAQRSAAIASVAHPTNMIPGVGGTAWAALNAVTYWADHVAKVRAFKNEPMNERRFSTRVLPDGALSAVKSAALRTATSYFFTSGDLSKITDGARAAIAAL